MALIMWILYRTISFIMYSNKQYKLIFIRRSMPSSIIFIYDNLLANYFNVREIKHQTSQNGVTIYF